MLIYEKIQAPEKELIPTPPSLFEPEISKHEQSRIDCGLPF
nr:MAG TPA: hypothetical protein [Caudoviricetes sp.]